MQYSLDKITTTEACDALLTMAQKKKQKLERQRRNLGESIGAFRKRKDYLEKESVRVQTSLDALKTAYQAMPEGREKMTIHIMIKRLELRRAQLEKNAYTCNVAVLLVKELRYNWLESKVAVMEEYIAALQQHTSTLDERVMSISQPAAAWHLEAAGDIIQSPERQDQAGGWFDRSDTWGINTVLIVPWIVPVRPASVLDVN